MEENVEAFGGIDDTTDVPIEKLLVEFRDAWGEAHVHAGECNSINIMSVT